MRSACSLRRLSGDGTTSFKSRSNHLTLVRETFQYRAQLPDLIVASDRLHWQPKDPCTSARRTMARRCGFAVPRKRDQSSVCQFLSWSTVKPFFFAFILGPLRSTKCLVLPFLKPEIVEDTQLKSTSSSLCNVTMLLA